MSKYLNLFGAVFDKAETERIVSSLPHPVFSMEGPDESVGKTRLLYEYYEKVVGHKYDSIYQQESDCVSCSNGAGIDFLRCIQSIVDKTYESFTARVSTEIIYGGSRIEIGRGQLGRGGGSMNIWAAQFLQQYGALLRGKYGKYDLTNYNVDLVRLFANIGVPDELEPTIKEHPLKAFSPIRTWEEFRQAIYNFCPVTISSNRGFNTTRDKNGFLTGHANWPHSQLTIGVKDDNRPGGLVVNSWGDDWVNGPKGDYDIPNGAYWIDADVLERDFLSGGDCFAFSLFDGWKPLSLDLNLF